jgi:hypothetical protein
MKGTSNLTRLSIFFVLLLCSSTEQEPIKVVFIDSLSGKFS